MNSKIKKLWVAALRSGKYKQIQHKLHDKNGFCCLGVLCDLHRKKMKSDGWIKFNPCYLYLDHSGNLPTKVVKWAGLKNGNPHISNAALTNWNDTFSKSFEWIADAIEKEL